MPGSGNQPRFTGERLLFFFAAGLLLLGIFQVVQAARRDQLERSEDSLSDTAMFDNELFPGILERNYVSQFWDPLTSFEGKPLFRRSSGVDNWHEADKIIAVGRTDDGRHTVYRAEWAQGEGVYVLKFAATNGMGEARFVEVGPQLHFREQYEAQKRRWAEEARQDGAAEDAANRASTTGESGPAAEADEADAGAAAVAVPDSAAPDFPGDAGASDSAP